MSGCSGPPLLGSVPPQLVACWERLYIKQTFRDPRPTDHPEGGKTWYLQSKTGLCVDSRIDLTGSRCHDCFLGVAVYDEKAGVLNWHPVVGCSDIGKLEETSPHNATTAISKLASRIKSIADKAQQHPDDTEDRGLVQWQNGGFDNWLELDVEGGSSVLEELWVRKTKNIGGAANQECEDVKKQSDSTLLFSSNEGEGLFFRKEGEQEVDTYAIRSSAESDELVLQVGAFFAHVQVTHANGKTEFSMGSISPDDGKWGIELSTVDAKIGTEYVGKDCVRERDFSSVIL